MSDVVTATPHIFEVELPEGHIIEVEAPKDTPLDRIKTRAYQEVLKHPELSPSIAKQQGYQAPNFDPRSAGEVALDQVGNVIKGAASFVANAPSMGLEAAKAYIDLHRPGQELEGLKRIRSMAVGAAQGQAAPVTPILQTATSEMGLTPPPSRQQWEQGAQAAGANAMGLAIGEGARRGAAALPDNALRLQELANKARAIRADNPFLSVNPSSPGGALRVGIHPVNAVKGVSAAVAAPVLEQAAKLGASMDTTPTAHLNFPEKEPVGDLNAPTTRGFAAADEAHRSLQWQDAPWNNPLPGVESEKLNIQRPGLSTFDQEGLNNLRQQETPEQLYQRQQAQRNVEIQPAPTEAQPLGIQRPGVNVNDQAFLEQLRSQPPASQFEHPIQQLTPDEAGILNGIFREGKGAAASTANMNLAIQNAPYLLEVLPELKNTPPGQLFDAKLFNGFQRVGHELKAAEASIPDSTPVPTADAVAKLGALQQEAAATMQNSAVRAIEKVKSQLEEKPVMEWGDFIKAKRAFDNEIGVDSAAGRQIYQIFKETSNSVSPKLGELNQKYYTLRTALDLAKMNPFKGLRLAEVAAKAKGLRAKK